MTQPLRIVVADDEPDMREYLRRVLPRLGHDVVGVASTGRELVEVCRAARPDLVITDIKMPELDGIDAACELYRERPVAVVLVSAHADAELIERAAADHVLGYLVKPIKQADLAPVITLAWKRFVELEQVRAERKEE
jgi:response regulator NasT